MNKNIEGLFVEINLRNKKKWILSCSYNPTKMQISNHLAELSKGTDLYLTKYNNLKSMINRPTCFKDPDKPSCVDLNLTN